MKNFLKSKIYFPYLLIAILVIGLIFRLNGFNWDQNQHLHPDERFLTMVIQSLQWPGSIIGYLNSSTSSLNPYNTGYPFYVYGTLPLLIVKYFAQFFIFDNFDYNNITLVGRFISALFDLVTLALVYKIGRKLFSKKLALTAGFLYAISVLPIQLSHFFTVDTFLTFFITLSFYFLILFLENKNPFRYSILLGISLGLALASKISAILFLPIIGLGFLLYLIKNKNIKHLLLCSFFFVLCCYFSFRIADPHVFSGNLLNPSLNTQFVQNIKELKSFDNPKSLFPPGVQWIKTKPIIFPLQNMILWGFGLPLGMLVMAGFFYSLYRIVRDPKYFSYLLILFWILLLFIYQGIQYSKTMRYFYPIYPFLAILAADFLVRVEVVLRNKLKNSRTIILLSSITLILITIWPLSFIAIYSHPHSRVGASEWIYQNIPAGSVITCEYWDDCLPLNINRNSSLIYKTEMLTMYDPDNPGKWNKINNQLKETDYLILSSNRLWGSIPKVPEIYPLTSGFYQDLFAGKLGFTKVAEITSYPTVPTLNIPISDDSAEEAFTVFDHPKILIYKRVN